MECKLLRGAVSHVEKALDALLTDYVETVISMDTCTMGQREICVTLIYIIVTHISR
jgi:hypothetical protein